MKNSSKPNAFSKLIVNTKTGGVPFLNDYLASFFGFNFFNVKFSDLHNYTDLFQKYDDHLNKKGDIHPALHRCNVEIEKNKYENKLLSEFFKIENVYLSFMDSNEISDKLGSNEEGVYFINTNTGKGKVSAKEYIYFLNMFNADLNSIPYEYLSENCSKKRVNRCYNKILEFFKLIRDESINNKKFIIPIFMYNYDMIPLNTLNEVIGNENNNIKGYLLFIENYKKLNLEKIQKYKHFVMCNLNEKYIINFGVGHPIDIMISYEIGCRYFELSYPFDLSEKGLSILSNYKKSDNLSCPEKNLDNLNDYELNKIDLRILDLNDKIYANDLSILKEHCSCFTCNNKYTRAYIHHLLKCKELNANILIIMHNLHFIQNLYNTYTNLESDNERFSYLIEFLNNECILIE